jgi:anti-sigma B factor antagonist
MLDSASTFFVTVRPESDRVVVLAQGELDVATVPLLEHEVRALRAAGSASIVLDLRELTFMDSTGVRLLLQLDAEARSGELSFAILDCEGPVRRVLALTGVADRLPHARP